MHILIPYATKNKRLSPKINYTQKSSIFPRNIIGSPAHSHCVLKTLPLIKNTTTFTKVVKFHSLKYNLLQIKSQFAQSFKS